MNPQEQELRNNEARSRYELWRGGEVAALVQYRVEGDVVRLVHTEVDERYEGQGLGSRIAVFALEDARTRGLKVRAQCPFIAAYVARHMDKYGMLLQS